MDLNLNEKNRELFIKTTLWNILVYVFKQEKKIDIEKYIISIKVKGNYILIKTNKPIFNSEALLLDEKIKKIFFQKLQKVSISEKDFIFKYI